MPKHYFYDIESLDNVFTLCNFKPDENELDVYYLSDDPKLSAAADFENKLKARIYEKNDNFNGQINIYNLADEPSNVHLATMFGLSDARSVNDPNDKSSYPQAFRPVCDTDPNYDDEIDPYLWGYNSFNYDTTMLAMYFHDAWPITFPIPGDSKTKKAIFKPITAHQMRVYNDELFEPEFKGNMPLRLTKTFNRKTRTWTRSDYSDPRFKIRKSMMMSGRHLDVSRINEKMVKVGLKRLLGMMGYQILESNKLSQGQDHIDNADQLYDLIAYNTSDVVNLKELFNNKFYQGQFSLKKGLLQTYPELIYEQQKGAYKPDINPARVRRDRLTIDSSSAQFATKALCPYEHLTDYPAVSFMYPSEQKSKELGIPRVNVLEETNKFFLDNFSQPELRAKWDRVYRYYKSIEGKNFNDSQTYFQDFGNLKIYQPPEVLAKVPKTNTCLFYYNKDGSPSTCFVTFSTGGIHGAECNKELFDSDWEEWETKYNDMEYVKSIYPDPIDLKKAKVVTMADGTERPAKDFLKSGSTMKKAFYKDLERTRPQLFVEEKSGSWKLHPKYVYTSADPTNHEDFTSYYPNMLRMMSAFWNEGLGYDRYAEIFDNKQKYGQLMKDKSLTEEEREKYSILREGTKLILNSASGAGDSTFESSIRVNNKIISMRIIGQLFTYRIGQAQTIRGAKITSTNTDGLYSVLEATLNNKILAEEAANIGVEIEPEPTYLISKDSNNRIEMNPDDGTVESASGGTLACRKGPVPTKALAHPAIIDWALTEYLIVAALQYKDLNLNAPFDPEIGLNILKSASIKFEKRELIRMFQNVIASSVGSINYIYATRHNALNRPIILQHYNRVFIMKDGTPNTYHLFAANAKKITPAQITKRRRENERLQQNDPLSIQVLNAHGVSKIEQGKEAVIKKITNIEADWYMYVDNRNIFTMSEDDADFILDNLDYEKYLLLMQESYNKNWKNRNPNEIEEETPVEDDIISIQSDPTDIKLENVEINVTDKISISTPSGTIIQFDLEEIQEKGLTAEQCQDLITKLQTENTVTK